MELVTPRQYVTALAEALAGPWQVTNVYVGRRGAFFLANEFTDAGFSIGLDDDGRVSVQCHLNYYADEDREPRVMRFKPETPFDEVVSRIDTLIATKWAALWDKSKRLQAEAQEKQKEANAATDALNARVHEVVSTDYLHSVGVHRGKASMALYNLTVEQAERVIDLVNKMIVGEG